MNWVMSVLMALIGFLGVSIWNGQNDLTKATFENTMALRELTVEFKGYVTKTEEARDRFEQIQREIIERMNRNNMKP